MGYPDGVLVPEFHNGRLRTENLCSTGYKTIMDTRRLCMYGVVDPRSPLPWISHTSYVALWG